MADALDLGSSAARHVGSSPSVRTILKKSTLKLLIMEIATKNVYDKKLKKEYQIIVPFIVVDKKVNDYIKKAQKNFSLNGFRKGHVPEKLIKEKYGASITADELDKIISETLKKIINDNKLKLAISPKVDIKKFEIGQDAEITISFEIFPEVPEIELNKIKVVKKEVKISEEDISKSINEVAKRFCTWNKQENSYKAKIGDAVNIDYVGKIDKKEFEGGAAKNYQLELGSKSFIDDFEEQLVGKKEGDEVKVKVTFPKNYHKEDLSSKDAEFYVKVNHILCADLPELSDDFIKKNFNIENKEKFNVEISKGLKENYDKMSKSLFKKDIFEFLNKKYDFEIPDGMIENQLEDFKKKIEQQEKFKNEKERGKVIEKERKEIEKLIRFGIILSDLAKKNKIEATNEDFNNQFIKMLSGFDGDQKTLLDYYKNNPDEIDRLKNFIVEQKIIDFIISTESIEKKQYSTKEFLKLWEKSRDE